MLTQTGKKFVLLIFLWLEVILFTISSIIGGGVILKSFFDIPLWTAAILWIAIEFILTLIILKLGNLFNNEGNIS